MDINELQELQENAGLAVALLKRMAHKDRFIDFMSSNYW